MRLSVAFAVVFLCGIGLSQSPEPSKPNKTATAQQNTPSDKRDAQTDKATTTTPPPNNSSPDTDKHQHSENSDNRIYRVHVVSEPTSGWTIAYVIITAILGIIGIATIVLLFLQNRSAHSATRARIDVIFSDAGRVQVKNFGQSAAHITRWQVFHATYRSDVDIHRLPQVAQRLIQQRISNEIVSEKESGEILNFVAHHYLSPEELQGQQIAIFTATVDYIDIFEQSHQTTVAYSWSAGFNYLPALTKYK